MAKVGMIHPRDPTMVNGRTLNPDQEKTLGSRWKNDRIRWCKASRWPVLALALRKVLLLLRHHRQWEARKGRELERWFPKHPKACVAGTARWLLLWVMQDVGF